jgi:hypothetical protein
LVGKTRLNRMSTDAVGYPVKVTDIIQAGDERVK